MRQGTEAHKAGRLAAAEELYTKAVSTQTDSGSTASAGSQETTVEALHLLGALKVQRLAACQAREADSDEEDGESTSAGSGGSAGPGNDAGRKADGAAAVALLRRALELQGAEGPLAARARLLSSLGVALVQLFGRESAAEAADLLREAAAADPRRWAAFFHLARALALLRDLASKTGSSDSAAGLDEERAAALRAAHRLRPDDPRTLYKLGMLLKERTDEADRMEAAECLERYLAQARRSAAEAGASAASAAHTRRASTASHFVAVLRGDATATPPAEYVAGLFDSYADKFDDHLVNVLGYRTPQMIADEIQRAAPCQMGFECCADLGCGTGLTVPLLRQLGVRRLEGVDLSAGMLRKARENYGPGVGYDRLVCGDLVDIFAPEGQGNPAPVFDLVIAADVFVYVGDLAPVLAATSQCLARPHGLVVFSTEAPPRAGGANEDAGRVPAGGFRLGSSGRYLHSAAYVRAAAEACGLTLTRRSNVVLRYNGGKPVHGHIHVLRPASALCT